MHTRCVAAIAMLALGMSARVAAQGPVQPESLRREAETVVFLVQYVGGDYPNAVAGGAVHNEAEYREIRAFTEEARRRLADLIAGEVVPVEGCRLLDRLDDLQRLLGTRADARQVQACADEVLRGVMDRFRVVSFPRRAPDPIRAAALFAQNCATCHGARGAGDGPSAKDLPPPAPAPFSDPEFLDGLTPYQAYNAITQGIAGTAMPSFRDAWKDDGIRWDLAFHLWSFDPREEPRAPPVSPELPLREHVIRSTRALAGDFLAGRWGVKAATPDEALGWARWVRRHPAPDIAPADRVLLVQEGIERAWAAFRDGKGEAAAREVTDLYLNEIEPIEPDLEARDRAAKADVESALAEFQYALRTGEQEEARRAYGAVQGALDRARGALASDSGGAAVAAFQSGTIILREGVEAALLVGLILAALRRANRPELKRYVLGGLALALAAGAGTWFAATFLIGDPFAGREVLEGVVSLLAAAVLVCVTFWLIRRADMEWWTTHLKAHAGRGTERGSGWVLAGATFLAVYREAFETVLFYQALLLRSAGAEGSVLAGFGAGLAVLLAAIGGILWFGVRVRLRSFFAVTGILLGALALTFLGEGLHALQISGLMPLTPFWRGARFEWLGVYPSAEPLVAQGLLLVLFATGVALRWRAAGFRLRGWLWRCTLKLRGLFWGVAVFDVLL